jgi:hypothetical protein
LDNVADVVGNFSIRWRENFGILIRRKMEENEKNDKNFKEDLKWLRKRRKILTICNAEGKNGRKFCVLKNFKLCYKFLLHFLIF